MVATSTASMLIAFAFFVLGWVARSNLDPMIDKYKAWRKTKKDSEYIA